MDAGESVREMLDAVEDGGRLSLSRTERLMLATDGTVTHMLEALTGSPVEVDIISRESEGPILNRCVSLRSDGGRVPLVWAESEVNLEPLSPPVASGLVDGDHGIGDVLREKYAETRREVEDMGVVRSGTGEVPDFINDAARCYLRRTYKVYSDGEWAMTITEYFPRGVL